MDEHSVEESNLVFRYKTKQSLKENMYTSSAAGQLIKRVLALSRYQEMIDHSLSQLLVLDWFPRCVLIG